MDKLIDVDKRFDFGKSVSFIWCKSVGGRQYVFIAPPFGEVLVVPALHKSYLHQIEVQPFSQLIYLKPSAMNMNPISLIIRIIAGRYKNAASLIIAWCNWR